MIRDRLVYGTNSRKVRERFINREADLNLQNAIDIACALESAQSQLKNMEGGESAQVQSVKSNQRRRINPPGEATGFPKTEPSNQTVVFN